METAIFINSVKAVATASALNSKPSVKMAHAATTYRQGEILGYKVKVNWADGSYSYLTDDQYEEFIAS